MTKTIDKTISVIIPAYRCQDTLPKAAASALNQEGVLEVLVLDDCSGEDIQGALGTLLEDPRLHYCKNEKNLGAAGTRNRGVRMAKGAYVAFLDADDWWEEGKLAAQMELLEKTKDVLCCTGRALVSPDGQETGKYIPVKERLTYRDLLKHNSINCSSVLLRRDVALQYPMEHEDSHEDYITWLKILQKYGTASGIDQPFLKYRLTGKGKSGSKLQSAGMTFKVYRYMGFGMGKSIVCFLSYAIHGVWKYR